MLNDLPKVTRSLVEIPKETPPCPAALSVHIHVPNAETWGGGRGVVARGQQRVLVCLGCSYWL